MMRQLIIAAFVFFHAVSVDASKVSLRTRVRARNSFKNPMKPVFMPPTMLLISTPMERKVSYAQISNFKSVGGVVLPILDSGLSGPFGISWDGPRSALYIADAALRKIFRVKLKAFKCARQCKGIEYQLAVDGNQFTVVENVMSQWVDVDGKGNLYFTDQETNSVNKLPVETITKIIKGNVDPKDLKRTTEPEAEGEEAAKENAEETEALSGSTTVTTTRGPSIFSLYEKDVSPNVGTPAGVTVSGSQLYWTNQVGGFSSGSVSYGKTDPTVKQPSDNDGKPSFPSIKFTNNTGAAYGVALTTSKVIFTDTSHTVWAASRGSGEVVALTQNMLKPRGVVWDKDNTVFVADQEGNFVVSLPCGLLKTGAPTSHVVDIHSPFGIALVDPSDPIWLPIIAKEGGARHIAHTSSLVVAIVCLALALPFGWPGSHK